MEIENKLKEMGLELPVSPTPAAHRAAAVRTGNLVFVGGHGARMPDGTLLHPGKLGRDVTIEQGQAAAQRTMLNCLAGLNRRLATWTRSPGASNSCAWSTRLPDSAANPKSPTAQPNF